MAENKKITEDWLSDNQRINKMSEIRFYVLAGNSTFSVKNETTGNTLYYKVEQPSIEKPFFIKAYDGEGAANYVYIGTLFQDGEFKTTTKTKLPNEDERVKTMRWLVKHLMENMVFPSNFTFIKSDKCCHCGTELRSEASKARGISEECERLLADRARLWKYIKQSMNVPLITLAQ
jgi:hypothetical protein